MNEKMIREMLKAAEMNTKATREEKTEMKNTTTEPKTYNCKVALSKAYTITANTPNEARNKATMMFMAEAIDDTPHELLPLIEIKEANAEPDDTDMWAELIQEEKAGIEKDDPDWNYEEDEIHYELYYKDGTGYRSDKYETIDDILEDISDRYRLTLDETNELEDEIIDLLERDGDDLDWIDYDLPFANLEIWRDEVVD